ncbi:MAG: hypothetical protein WD274_10455 [Acidimicrobiia bacterium]
MTLYNDFSQVFQHSPPPRMVLLLDRSADTFIARRARADASVVKPLTAAELRSAVAPKVPATVPSGGAEEK